MAQIVEFLRSGYRLEGLSDDVARDVDALCELMIRRTTDAVLALGIFENAMTATHERFARMGGDPSARWEQKRTAEREREAELAALNPPPSTEWWDPERRAWEAEIRDRARRDVLRARWASGELPEAYLHQLPMLHAHTFVTALAQVFRALDTLAELELGEAREEVAAARDAFSASLPNVMVVRHSIEHAEERARGLARSRPLTLQPILNSMIHAPGGGVLALDNLMNRNYGCTVEDGSYAEVEISDATVELARVQVQHALDALPWHDDGIRNWTPPA